jgi:Arc/MetJ-type ribon-helix-helix transcriptional regulator
MYTENTMPTTVTLSPELAKFVDDLVQTGKFATREEAVNDALMRRKEEIEWLRAEHKPAIDALDRGEYVEFTAEDIIREGRARLAQHKK